MKMDRLEVINCNKFIYIFPMQANHPCSGPSRLSQSTMPNSARLPVNLRGIQRYLLVCKLVPDYL